MKKKMTLQDVAIAAHEAGVRVEIGHEVDVQRMAEAHWLYVKALLESHGQEDGIERIEFHPSI